MENRVYLVHANPPADGVTTGSHGQSRVIDTDGNLIKEAGSLEHLARYIPIPEDLR